MSYLDPPRLHFAGEFFADPSTPNNFLGSCCDPASGRGAHECSYNPAVTIDGDQDQEGWNKDGRNLFQLRNCVVRGIVDSRGSMKKAPQDLVIGGSVVSTDQPRAARFVDLDPSYQTASQIWGLAIKVTDQKGESVTGRMQTGTLRELWATRAPGGFAAGFGGVFQSVLGDLQWTSQAGRFASPFLEALRSASPLRLSIKLVVYAYSATPGPTFTFGRVVGTIGPAPAGEPASFTIGRLLRNPSAVFGDAPFKVDVARKRLVLDLGNAIPEVAPAGARVTLGKLQAQIDEQQPRKDVTIGDVAVDRAHYEETAGIEELPLSAAQVTRLATRPLRLRAAGPPARAVLWERATGRRIDVTETAIRLNPGDSQVLEFTATAFGKPAGGVSISLRLGVGTPASALIVDTGPWFLATLALPGSVTTSAAGTVAIQIEANDPGHPRTHIDGQTYVIDYFDGSPSPANKRGEIAVRVFDTFAAPAKPTFADVRDILVEYFRLYPSMRFLDLSDVAVVRAARTPIETALRRPIEDPGYMPVTRDLSRDKKDLLLRWLAAGAPS